MALVLVLGGVRSGKSEVAERIAAAAGAPVCYLATGAGADPEMAERIERHRARRPAAWRTVESDDPGRARVAAHETLLVDGIAPWLARRMAEEGLWTDEAVAPLGSEGRAGCERALATVRSFARAAAGRPGMTVVVAEESGLGLVPSAAGMRRYLDLAGEAAQTLAEHADQVLLVIAGRPLDLTRHPPAPAFPPPTPPAPAGGAGGSTGRGQHGLRDLGELRVHGDGMVGPGQLDFAVNVVPGGPPEWLRGAMVDALAGVGSYPDERAAVAALAVRHGREPDEVMATNGSAEAFWLLAAVLRPRRAVVVHPSFTEPEAALRAAEHRVERAFRDPDDFTLDPSAIPEDADLLVLGNPNNPTGTLDPAALLAHLARPGRVVVVDEAFMELVPGEPETLAGRPDPGGAGRPAARGGLGHHVRAGADRVPGLVVVRSLTKLWSLAGVRAGYLLGPPHIVAAARSLRQPWSVNGLACAALAAWARRTAVSGGDEAVAIAGRVAAARARFTEDLAALPGVRVWPSVANFLLLRVPDGPAVRAGLSERGVAVRRADSFPGLTGDHLRVAVRDPQDNRRLVETLREVLARPAPAGAR
ncbi:MAG TPA: Rv2231c family pyridoxal phosphate-dependent protein CobC [Actinomycetes bacterium]|nr:Rv2231c family pyridoxal phosphate-dependent protein CobC [Actinomycetes bacterium]